MNDIELIQHEADIYALAVSPDEQLLACGGGNTAVTLWNLAEGTLLARLDGLAHQVQALAFSPDGARLAAADLWGGLCVWQVADGRLLEQKPSGKSRKFRSLVYPEYAPKSRLPMMLSESIHSQKQRVLAPNGKRLAVRYGAFDVKIMQYRTATELSKLDLSRHAVTRAGASTVAWTADSQAVGLAGPGWAGIWLPLAPTPQLYAQKLAGQPQIAALAVLRKPWRILFAVGNQVKIVGIKERPLLTEWQTFLSQIPEPAADSGFQAKQDWTWAVTQWGHEGVHTFEAGQLVWYSHSHNPHGGGGAAVQSYADFLENGPNRNVIPEDLLIQLSQAVRQLAR